MSDASVKMLYADGNQYEGDLMNNKRHGRGKMIYSNGDVYDGQWDYDEKHGHGVYKYANGA